MYNGYAVFCVSMAIFQHFRTGNYDCWKYNFKVNCSEEAYLKRGRDVWGYSGIQKRFPTKKEQIMYFYPCYLYAKNTSLSNLRSFENSYRLFNKFLHNEMWDVITKDISIIFKNVRLNQLHTCEPGKLPVIIDLAYRHNVNLMTLCLLFKVFPLLNSIDGRDNFVTASYLETIKKNSPFMMMYICNDDYERLYEIISNQVKKNT